MSSGRCSRTRPRPPRARARLAALARVRPAPGGHELDDLRSALRARLAPPAVDEELVLERAADAVGVAEVVDRRAAGGEGGGGRGAGRPRGRGGLRSPPPPRPPPPGGTRP